MTLWQAAVGIALLVGHFAVLVAVLATLFDCLAAILARLSDTGVTPMSDTMKERNGI